MVPVMKEKSIFGGGKNCQWFRIAWLAVKLCFTASRCFPAAFAARVSLRLLLNESDVFSIKK